MGQECDASSAGVVALLPKIRCRLDDTALPATGGDTPSEETTGDKCEATVGGGEWRRLLYDDHLPRLPEVTG